MNEVIEEPIWAVIRIGIGCNAAFMALVILVIFGGNLPSVEVLVVSVETR